MGEHEKSLNITNKLLENNPNNILALQLRRINYYFMDKYQDSLDELLDIDSNDVDIRRSFIEDLFVKRWAYMMIHSKISIGLTYQMDKFEDSLEKLNSSLKIKSDNALFVEQHTE
ncbi:hypothetical protein C2G38_2207936 [Gigaspora rosea]|uniref:Uncharacterized protein n=1 Tax=Gigaspora rosea TaxID=44941 RepID=A0A397URG0_9GLOM|nr:hypothetical protein C2G38_2207936 [Gigaspora rosea]